MRKLVRSACFYAALAVAIPVTSSGQESDIARKYSEYCSVCHGDRGQGGLHAQQGMMPPPRNFTDPTFRSTITREQMIAVIRNGKPGTAMIAWGSTLEDAEIEGLADYIIGELMPAADVRQSRAAQATTRADAETIYQESCSVCHGDDGKGAIWGQESLSVPPRNFTTDAARRELTRDRMIASVTFGRPGTPMPGFGTQLQPEQVESVVDYVRERFISGATATAETGATAGTGGNPVATGAYHQAAYPGDLEGRYERGRDLYVVNCVTCHGVAGAGDGPRAYFIFPRPRNFQDPATQEIMNRPTLFRGVKDGVIGREMPAWGKVFDDQAIADVSEYVYREFIRSDSAD